MLAVKRVGGVPTIFPADSGEVAPEENLLRVRVLVLARQPAFPLPPLLCLSFPGALPLTTLMPQLPPACFLHPFMCQNVMCSRAHCKALRVGPSPT